MTNRNERQKAFIPEGTLGGGRVGFGLLEITSIAFQASASVSCRFSYETEVDCIFGVIPIEWTVDLQ